MRTPRPLFTALLLALPAAAGLAALAPPPLATKAVAWAAGLAHGAVATAEKRDGAWQFALAGEPFASGHAAVPAARVIFEIGSISKVFTGILLADAVAAGKLGLEDTLAQRLTVRFRHAAAGGITLRQLATHTSCLPRLPDNMLHADAADPYATYDKRALFEYLATAKPEGEPPCASSYSNLGLGILGVVLEETYGKPWAMLVREKITTPLGMMDTAQVLSAEQQTRFAEPWNGDQRAQPWTFQAMAGAGALRSTLGDMSKFADALLAGAHGPRGKVWPMLAGDYAAAPGLGGKLGLALEHVQSKDADGRPQDSYMHDGGTGGYRSLVSVWPESGRAVVILASNGAATPTAWLPRWQSSAQAPAVRTEITLPAAALDEYTGVYSIDKSARFTIVRRGDGLVARLTGQPFIPFYAGAPDEFFYKLVDAQLSFHRNASGKIDRLTLHQNGRDIPAARDAVAPPHIEFPSVGELAELAGDYDFGKFQPGATIQVSAKAAPAGVLLVTLTGQQALPVFAVSKDRFEYDVVVAALTFERDAAGKVVAVVLHQNGFDMKAPRR